MMNQRKEMRLSLELSESSVKIENERGGKRIKNQCRKKTNIPYKEKKKVTATCLPFASLAGESAAGMYE